VLICTIIGRSNKKILNRKKYCILNRPPRTPVKYSQQIFWRLCVITLSTSIIIPCFNEEAVIEEAYARVKAVMKNFKTYEIIFINDGSRDRTLEILARLAKTDKTMRVISFSRNFGHQAAVTAGVRNASGDAAIIIDADLQDPPELFPEMIRLHLEEGANVVYGQRTKRKGETIFKKLTAKLYYRLLNKFSEVPMHMDTGDFRLIDRKVMDAFCEFSEKNKYIRGIISWVGFKQVPIQYVREPRFAGETKYPLRKMLKFAMSGLLYFTKKPLKLAMNLGIFCIVIGLGLALWSLILYFSNEFTVPGWSSQLITIVFFGGVQLFTIGVLGGYIGSIFDEVKDRPEYIIGEKLNFPALRAKKSSPPRR
jgi:dolichol-phosphate mannosyltransferase